MRALPATALLLSIALAAALPPAGPAPAPAQEPASGALVLDDDLRALVPELVELMRRGIETTDPNRSVLQRVAGAGPFDGSYDLHSCLFAHWALLVTARVEQDLELENWLLERLTPEALDALWERIDGLDHDRLMTYPYDQAWLLVVLSELEGHLDPLPESLRAFRLVLEERLVAWLETSPFPENDDPHAIDFLWVPALVPLIDELAPERVPAPYDPSPFPALPATVSLRDVHVLGVEVSRLWPLAIRARQGDSEARERYHARMREILERRDLWAEDFEVVTHWVPQFLWFGTWLADGRP